MAVISIFALAALAPPIVRATGRASGWLLAILPLTLTVYFARFVVSVSVDEQVVREAIEWLPALEVSLSLRLDGLSLLFALLICGIGTLIVVYAGTYLAGHRDLGRFFAWLLGFMGSMLGLVLADNIIALFVFWELTSITSYMLIGFDHDRAAARSAALQALLVTGLGGLAMLAGLILLAHVAGSYELSEIISQRQRVVQHDLYLPALLLILAGAFTKSAQFPFHFWLPSAMEAPTPVSAYLHSSTMVKAGVYLLARLQPAMGGEGGGPWQWLLVSFGAVTMLFTAYLAFRQTYLKVALAYSTASTLGILTMLIGLGSALALQAAMAFLLAHALYKAALFLIAGAIDHETGESDVNRLGGLWRAMPMTAAASGLAALSMIGLPPFFGYIAKEALFEAAWTPPRSPQLAAPLISAIIIAAMFLVAVTLIVAVKPFAGSMRSTSKNAHEAPLALWLGPIALAVGGLVFGLMQALADPITTSAAHAIASIDAAPDSALAAQPPPVEEHAQEAGHGPILLFEAIAVILGIALFAARHRIARVLAIIDLLHLIGPARWYRASIVCLNAVASWQTRVLQSGYLRTYLLIMIVTTIGLVGSALIFWHQAAGRIAIPLEDWSRLHGYESLVAGLIVIGTIITVYSSSRLAAIAALGVVGYGVAIIFIMFGAPDLAITQVLVDTLTVILLVLAFYHLPPYTKIARPTSRVRDGVIALIAGAMMTGLVLIAGAFPLEERAASGFYAEHSFAEARGRNVVNVILVDFRALDTLGEITVLAVAAIGVYSLLHLTLEGRARR